MRDDGSRFWVVLAAVLLVAGAYSGFYAMRGWIPHDEGVLGEMAERVLDGELPHADFDETYSGGLTLLNAASFALFGHRSSSLRVTLWVFQLGFLASVFSIAARAAAPAIAALITLLCVAWGLPNYSAGLPSWYNLGLAIIATHAAIKFVETERAVWLFLAGFLGGLSCLFKVAGIYVLLALYVFLIYRDRVVSEGCGDGRAGSPVRLGLVLVALALPIVLLLGVTWARLGVMEFIYFILPGAVVCGLVAWNEVRYRHVPRPPLLKMARPILYLALGASIPVAVFLVPYVLRGELYSFYRGLFVLPQLRFERAFYPMPPVFTLFAALPPAAAICLPLFSRRRAGTPLLAVVVAFLATLLALGFTDPVYAAVWSSARPLGPIAAVLLCVVLVGRQGDSAPAPQQRQLLFLMAAMTAFFSVIQFPYAFGVYFFYAAPPIVLALLFAASMQSTSWSKIQLCFVLFYIGFGLLWLNTANVRATGVYYERSEAREVLFPERLNLRVSEADKAVYEALVGVIDEVAGNDPYIMATPDCPEVYFLSRRKNPTRVMYEFFDPLKPTPEQVLANLASKGVRVVVLNSRPEFSEGVSEELFRRLTEAYPEHVDVGWFRVLWKT